MHKSRRIKTNKNEPIREPWGVTPSRFSSSLLFSIEKNETSFETSMKQILKPKDFARLKLVIGGLEKKDEIMI